MSYLAHSPTKSWPLEDVVARLAQHDTVHCVMQIGSLSRKELSPDSDYDLVVILESGVKAWQVGITWIDNRFADIILVDRGQIQEVVQLADPVAHNHTLAPIIRWLREGEILYARSDVYERAQDLILSRSWLIPPEEEERFRTWFSINYDVAQTRRAMQASDPLYRRVAAVRMAVYGQRDVWFGYFTLRRLPWTGDKAAIGWLLENDPAFLTAYESFINSPADSEEKQIWYERAAALATEPLGGLLPPEATAMNVAASLTLWEQLISDSD